jgi:hypothetical protein
VLIQESCVFPHPARRHQAFAKIEQSIPAVIIMLPECHASLSDILRFPSVGRDVPFNQNRAQRNSIAAIPLAAKSSGCSPRETATR